MPIRSATLMVPIIALASGVLAGCGSGDETDRIKLVPVNGTVTHNGKPLEGANVTFTPDPSNASSTPGGDTTGTSGNFKVIYRGRSGLAPGKYKVIVAKTLLPPGVAAGGGDDDYMNQLATESAAAARGRKADLVTMEIRGEFDRDVPPEGAVVDMDVKANPRPIAAP